MRVYVSEGDSKEDGGRTADLRRERPQSTRFDLARVCGIKVGINRPF